MCRATMAPKGFLALLMTWLVCAPMISAAIPQETKDTIETGLEKGTEIAEFLSDYKETAKLLRTAGSIAEKALPFLNAIGPIAGLVFLFLPSEDDAFQREMRREFREVHRKLDLVMDRLAHVDVTVNWHVDRNEFYQYTSDIGIMVDNLNQLAESNHPEQKKQNFITEYKPGVGENLKKMLLGEDRDRSIVELYKEYTENYRSKVLQFMAQGIKYLILASEVEVAYLNLQGRTQSYIDEEIGHWREYINEVQDKMIELDEYDINEAETYAAREIDRQLGDMTPRELTQEVADYLMCKYFWKKWLVFSYVLKFKGDSPDASFDYKSTEFNIYRTMPHPDGEDHERRFILAYTDINRSFNQLKARRGLDDYKKDYTQRQVCRRGWWGRVSCSYEYPDKDSATCKNNRNYAGIAHGEVSDLGLGQDLAFVISHCHDTYFSATDGSLAKMYNVHRCRTGDCSNYMIALFG